MPPAAIAETVPAPPDEVASRPPSGRGGAWMRLLRLSNLPTVWTNAAAGAGLAAGVSAHRPFVDELGRPVAGPTIEVVARAVVLAGIAGSMLYAGGMALNDACDARVDLERGVPRPIPQGEIARGTAFAAAATMLGIGIALPILVGVVPFTVALGLALCVVGYDVLNKRLPAAIVLMGACRGLLLVLAAALVDPRAAMAPFVLGPAAAITAYVVMVTACARGEHAAGGGTTRTVRTLALLLPAPLLGAAAGLLTAKAAAGAADPRRIVLAAAFAAWLLAWHRICLRRLAEGHVAGAIMGWLAMMALADGMVLAAVAPSGGATWVLVGICTLGFVLTVRLQRRIAGS